eukprot:4405067-Pyramimonas_sp.AAC.1
MAPLDDPCDPMQGSLASSIESARLVARKSLKHYHVCGSVLAPLFEIAVFRHVSVFIVRSKKAPSIQDIPTCIQ